MVVRLDGWRRRALGVCVAATGRSRSK